MNTPSELAEERVTLSAEYGEMTEELIAISKFKPLRWLELRKDSKSDKATDRLWEASPEGIKEMELRLRMKAYEKRLSSIRTLLEVKTNEARNLY